MVKITGGTSGFAAGSGECGEYLRADFIDQNGQCAIEGDGYRSADLFGIEHHYRTREIGDAIGCVICRPRGHGESADRFEQQAGLERLLQNTVRANPGDLGFVHRFDRTSS